MGVKAVPKLPIPRSPGQDPRTFPVCFPEAWHSQSPSEARGPGVSNGNRQWALSKWEFHLPDSVLLDSGFRGNLG